MYELKPYGLLLCGAMLALWFELGSLGQFCALTLMLLGATIWILRSNYRRQDKRPRRGWMPEVLYEYWPFILLVAATGLVSWQQSLLPLLLAALLAVRAINLLYYRNQYRVGPVKPTLGAH
ncbi:hypothetical protein [uncultured Ferrimonas sp.]|uniref:hypothetical protein n=1 Tax=uncultured Ferrimonas sp. TaxID=432640 RepID=UPI002626A948|nr:hypothetical protein [uncultured Ferrimonas sp.]